MDGGTVCYRNGRPFFKNLKRMKRRIAREHALKILYMADMRGEMSPSLIDEFYLVNSNVEREIKEFTERIVKGVFENIKEIDEKISSAILNWDFNRLCLVDRNILRIGTYEIIFADDIPPVVSINEALEIAKKYGTDDSPKFINGVLHRIKEEVGK